MRKLEKPPTIEGDDDATEMMRVWLAHDNLHVSLFLGMWADAEDCDIDECDAWGELMADTIQHVANGLAQSHNISTDVAISKISKSFLANLKDPQGDISGNYDD